MGEWKGGRQRERDWGRGRDCKLDAPRDSGLWGCLEDQEREDRESHRSGGTPSLVG